MSQARQTRRWRRRLLWVGASVVCGVILAAGVVHTVLPNAFRTQVGTR